MIKMPFKRRHVDALKRRNRLTSLRNRAKIRKRIGNARSRNIGSECKINKNKAMNEKIMLLTLKEVIGIAKISKSTVYRRIKEGVFPESVNLGGNCRRWLLKDIQDWVLSLN